MIRALGDRKPRIAETAFVSEAAYIMGDVEIGDYCTILPGVVIRGDTGGVKIGKYTNIQDNTVIHTEDDMVHEIGDYVTVGHGAVLHGHKIGNHVLIGMNATISEGAEIGDDCLIGSNALVTVGKRIPAGSLVLGAPAEVKGPLAERHKQAIEEGWQHYSEMGQKFKKLGLE